MLESNRVREWLFSKMYDQQGFHHLVAMLALRTFVYPAFLISPGDSATEEKTPPRAKWCPFHTLLQF